MKIAVMGYVGSGKTVLSRFLAEHYRIPKVELDEVAFDLKWMPTNRDVLRCELAKFMEQNSWVIDGNYNDLLQDERLEKADSIIFVMLPRIACLVRALLRTKERKAAGYQNDINPWFIRFLLFGCRNRRRRAQYNQIAHRYAEKLVVLKSQKEIDRFVYQVREGKWR